MVENRTIGLSTFHANIILSLSWMNNTNTFIYFLLYVHHRTQEGPAQIKLSWASWATHIKGELLANLWWKTTSLEPEETQTGARKSPVQSTMRRVVLILGSLHLSMMAALGIWLWGHPRSFAPADCDSTSVAIVILGEGVALRSTALRISSLAIYSLFL
ncbi:hypothetical protein B0H19DRAFT_282480, partial [Mycena capillaripes]